MPRAKSPRNGSASKSAAPTPETNVTAMPEVKSSPAPQSVSSSSAAAAAAPAPEPKKHVAPTPINVEEEIRRRAYELYQQRGANPGHEHEDWFVAEREVLSRYRQHSA